jgi:muramidase (phage lysozyme)
MLDLLAWSEGTSTDPITQNDGYDVIVSGESGRSIFTDYSDHPFAHGRPPVLVRPGLRSTASGRYQIMLHTWLPYKAALRLTDFSPASQDAVALQLIHERGAIPFVEEGDIATAARLCANIWASLPGSPYGQPTHPLEAVLAKWQHLTAPPAVESV